MRNTFNAALPVAIVFGVAVLTAQAPTAPRPTVSELAVNARDNLSELRSSDHRVETLIRSNRLVLRTISADALLEGRVHERYDQYIGGVRVFGGDIARQTGQGVTESVFGTLFDQVDIPTTPVLSEANAREKLTELSSVEFPPDRPIELVVLPKDEGGYALAWRTHVWSKDGWMHTFLDASSGDVLLQFNDLQTQAAVGTGTGVLGDQKKLSASSAGSRYVAIDGLRPARLTTFDLAGNLPRVLQILNGRAFSTTDVASDIDNVWTDAASVDAHVYLGWTYDFLFKRFGRHGLDGQNGAIQAITHPAYRADIFDWASIYGPDLALLFYSNAFWCPPPCGPGGRGLMVFGEGLPPGLLEQKWNYPSGGLDIAAHELTHGVTSYTSNLGEGDESAALNESFSDIVGTSVEFFFQASGTGPQHADYLLGEDVIAPPLRSMDNPQAFGHPDHYSRRLVGSRAEEHINAGIPNHAYYLAIEGGVNRTSGLTVQGVGAANRDQIERVFFRAFTSMLTSRATFRSARSATILSARELYGAGSPAERAVTQAWTAVGVN